MEHLVAQIPYLRRYARALTGNQATGDSYAAAVLETLIANPGSVPDPADARVELYRLFHSVWYSSGAPVSDDDKGKAARAQALLSRLTAGTREALLLSSLEDFTTPQIATILAVAPEEAEALVRIGQRELADAARGQVMIIEDEPIIAMDLENIVSDAGHQVFGVAQTHTEALKVGADGRPDLILADIRLADESSGIDAVNDLLTTHGEVPVIFVTAYPERLLTGDKPEPAFLISKPFRADQVLSAISQAMFFASTETLA